MIKTGIFSLNLKYSSLLTLIIVLRYFNHTLEKRIKVFRKKTHTFVNTGITNNYCKNVYFVLVISEVCT